MVPLKLVEPTMANYEEFLVISHQINQGESGSITTSTPVQRLLNLIKFNRMSVAAVKACVSVQVIRGFFLILSVLFGTFVQCSKIEKSSARRNFSKIYRVWFCVMLP